MVRCESFPIGKLVTKSDYGTNPNVPLLATTGEFSPQNEWSLFMSPPRGADDAESDPLVEQSEMTALLTVMNDDDDNHDDDPDDKDDFSTGRRILDLAIPALGALLIDPLLTLADTAFVGRYAESPYELAGMGSATALLTFSFYIFNFLCTATTPLVASKRSSGKEEDAIAVGRQSLSLALALGAILAILLITFRSPLLDLMGTAVSGVQATGYASDFLIIRALAAPAVFSISASTGILRGYLDTKTPIFVLLVANIVNFLLDVLLIVILGKGPAGAALATTTAEWISALLFLLILSGKLPSADGELGRKDNGGKDTLVITPSLSIPPWTEVQPLVVASSAVFLRTTILQLFLSVSAALAARGTALST
jgi:putative MATE family efflux protein